jgi:hypothetical protein
MTIKTLHPSPIQEGLWLLESLPSWGAEAQYVLSGSVLHKSTEMK